MAGCALAETPVAPWRSIRGEHRDRPPDGPCLNSCKLARTWWHTGRTLRTMSDDFQYDVFLSHSAKDKAVVREVAERLRKDGVKVWFDEWVLKPGDSIPAK